VAGLVEARSGDLYLNAVQGIVRVPAAELAAGLAEPAYPMRTERITEGDFTGPARLSRMRSSTGRAADGALWFSMLRGVVSYDPAAPRPAGRSPVLSIRSIMADRVPLGPRRTFDPEPRTLAIEYFGVHLTAPDRVRYRYKLDGFDEEWQDAGGRTEAVYTRPGPGTYTFRVMAANESGVWSAPIASAPFTVLPSFYQTRWFAALVAGGVVTLGWLAYALRVRYITRLVVARAEERADERVRIARELHDTLLGDMAGLAMQLSAVERRAEGAGTDAPIVQALATLKGQVQRTLVEARQAVTAMRSAPDELLPLHDRLAEVARRVFAGTEIAAHVQHAGAPRPLAPDAEAELVAVVTEAMTNARRHADCRTVVVALTYTPQELRVRIHDDGRGFDPSGAAPDGHWGLVGMRERAASIGAMLAVTSARGGGTEVVLVVPTAASEWAPLGRAAALQGR
jgi:signal transduction histidine kinase